MSEFEAEWLQYPECIADERIAFALVWGTKTAKKEMKKWDLNFDVVVDANGVESVAPSNDGVVRGRRGQKHANTILAKIAKKQKRHNHFKYVQLFVFVSAPAVLIKLKIVP